MVFTTFSLSHAVEHKTLTRDELEKFIKDTPVLISEVKAINEDRRLIGLFLHPDRVGADTVIMSILEDLSWEPDRYAYIFSRVIIAGFIRDMGQFGEGKLQFMKEQLEKWKASDEPEPEKSEMIENLTMSIKDLEAIVERTNRIPKMELMLMWDYRDELNEILMGKLPIGKKRMRVLR